MNHRQLSSLFSQLAVLDRAGMPPDKALIAASDAATKALRQRLERTADLVRRGTPIGPAAARAGLVDSLDAAVLEAAGLAGSMEDAFRRLADRHARADTRWRQVRSRLWLPGAVLVLGAVVAPLPALVAGRLDAADYVAGVFGSLAFLAGGLALAVKAGKWLRDTPLRRRFDAALIRAPLIGAAVARHSRTVYLESLSMLAGAGLPLVTALERAARVVPNRAAAESFTLVHTRVEGGATLAEAYAACPMMSRPSLRLLQAGEASGALDDTLQRAARLERAELEDLKDSVTTWIPRLAYLL
ncbi:MAG: type II secretion system F family protein, partial [Gammaproteobacteria bacterium]